MIKFANHQAVIFDPRDPAFRANPYPAYRVMRSQSPIYYRPEHRDWIITSYKDVTALLKDARLGQNLKGINLGIPDGNPLLSLRQKGTKLLHLWFSNQAPPDHTRLRKFFHTTFAPDQMANLQARIQALTDAYIDQIAAQGELDVIKDVGRPLAFTIICDILGIPEAARTSLPPLAHELQYGLDIIATRTSYERGLMAMVGLEHHFQSLIASWRLNPVSLNKLIGALMRAQAEGQLSEDELLSQCILILFAGQLNSQHVIGNGILALLRNPDQLQRLCQRPELLSTAVDELMRYDAPNQVLMRTALSDIEVAGKVIRTGEVVYLVIGAANRDPEMFPDPDRLYINRQPNPHLSFGMGSHYCIGAVLGKLEAQIAIGTLIRRLQNMRLKTEALHWEDTFVIHGLKSLPVVFN